MNVEEVMTKPVVTIQAQDTLQIAAQKMWDNDCGALPVVGGDGRLIGMLTDRDICMAAWSQGRLLGTIRVDEVMAKQVFAIKPEQEIGVAAKLMEEKQVRRIPVVDASEKPIGLVSMNDLAREAVRPGSRFTDGISRAIRTLAAICVPRKRVQKAA